MKHNIRHLIVLMAFLMVLTTLGEAQSRRKVEREEKTRTEKVETQKKNSQKKQVVRKPAPSRRQSQQKATPQRRTTENQRKTVERRKRDNQSNVQQERRRESKQVKTTQRGKVQQRDEIRRNRRPVDRDNRIVRDRRPTQRRTVKDRPAGRRYNDRYYRDYWHRYPKRKKHYIRYGWSPFFCLNLVPSIRFDIYTRPLINQRTQIVFVKEYDRYDYRPGDAVGYAVHISFSGRVRVYNRYYERQQTLAKEFYLSNWELRKLRRTLDRGDYYDDTVCLLEEYGTDRNPVYATIAYRPTNYYGMRKVAFNLAAPEEFYPDYLCDFMQDIDDILYDCGFFGVSY